jgi:AhpD family alkylhydroperoxidase
VGDREVMAAVVAQSISCTWCTHAHTAVASGAYRDRERVTRALADLDRDVEPTSMGEPLRATLIMLRKLGRTNAVDAEDMRAVLAAGAGRAQIEDALAVALSFNTVARLADTFGFTLASPEAFDAGAKYLLSRGYR